jgi:ABC-type antimicrobial peptide transport system permease subunit
LGLGISFLGAALGMSFLGAVFGAALAIGFHWVVGQKDCLAS